ncbi:unnamed protein product [Notodromas monacha]|uniref:ABC-2 type transporter transmembrane domain-containing protein n=1 Tax=Notodromas monacha TaxID=399045 RepID=A0A7R9GG27_9CRUS|nr:unnamed protein product [Notodromas monacha]CAG0919747.1 unnamed protein product [Notodromas monacha]
MQLSKSIKNYQGHGLYHVWVFFVTKTFFDLAWLVTLPLMTSGPTYFIVGLNLDPWSRMPLTVLYLILLTATNASLGYLFGIVFQRVSVVLPMIAFVNLVLYVAGGGFFANPRALPQMIAWIHKASWFFYTSEGLFANQWADVRFKCFEETNTTSPDCPYPDGNAVLETLGMSPEGRFRNLGVIASILAGMRVAAILLLYMRTRASLQKGS